MSADNYIVVYERYYQFHGFEFSASEHLISPPMPKTDPLWIVDSKEEAIAKCEEETYLEYGYSFYGE